jgi:hypothetical protein
MDNIDWIDISELPEAFKDGRAVLIWVGQPLVAWLEGDTWYDRDGTLPSPTHFAEVQPPT